MKRKKVLIVEDSAVMRKFLTEALSKSRTIEVVASAMDPYIAVDKIRKYQPDVLTLDIEMPRMDGLTFLSKLMIANPVPVIMVSAVTENGARETMTALELGALDFISKPKDDNEETWNAFTTDLVEKINAINIDKVTAKVKRRAQSTGVMEVEEKYSADVIIQRKSPQATKEKTDTLIAIGASTGGTEVIAQILEKLTEDTPGIVVTQHMPEKFTEAFANRIDKVSRLSVKEAEQGDRLYKGVALIAPGNRHMLVQEDRHGYWVEINDGPPVNRHRPSVDVLFRSTAQIVGNNAVGIILTGMGADGADGLLEMKQTGAVTIAQDEESSIVFGMPNEAIKRGAADYVKNIDGIINFIQQFQREKSA